MIDYHEILNTIQEEMSYRDVKGKVASYIPELARVDPKKFGMHLYRNENEFYGFGDHEEKFSIQSISKVFTLSLAIKNLGTKVWERVHVEPSGNPFNSLMQLEQDRGIPRNPFINSGALVISDILVDVLDNPKKELLEFVRKITGEEDIDYDESVAQSELSSGYRNIALVNYMKALGNIKCDVEEIIDFYFYSCCLFSFCFYV